jgi:hypothetical protein
MSLSCINPQILGEFNGYLSKCDSPFVLICVGLEGRWLVDLKEFASSQEDCHSVFGAPEVPYGLVALDKDTKAIAAYISFNISSPDQGPGKWCEEHAPLLALAIEFSCTGKSYRKLGLSKLLRLVIITYAIHGGYEEVVSSTNKVSGHILKKYFGFELADSTELIRENCAFKFELNLNARLILDKKHLEKHYQTYERMTKCKW